MNHHFDELTKGLPQSVTRRAALKTFGLGLAGMALAYALAAHAAPVSTSFTYQGQLKNNGVPVNTARDFRVTLYDRASSAAGVGQIGTPNLLNCQPVVNGLFTLTLNFGDESAYNCQGRWLEIEVRPCGGSSYQTLSPRVELLGRTHHRRPPLRDQRTHRRREKILSAPIRELIEATYQLRENLSIPARASPKRTGRK